MYISDGGNPPQFFSMEPQCGSPVREGDVKILQCQAYSIPAASYSWMKDGQVLQNERQSTLIMSNIDRAKAGAYRCIANNSHGAIISKSCDVVVACKYRDRHFIFVCLVLCTCEHFSFFYQVITYL